jgi:hypothetical protein
MHSINRLGALIKSDEEKIEELKNQSSIEQVKINTLESELIKRDEELNNLDKNI